MKLIRLVLLSGFWLLCGCPNGIGADYLDQKTYALEDEASYAVLIYDIHNSFILSLLGVQSDGPDQAGQIEALRKRDEYAVLDQELFAALVKGSMNLPAIKERTIREIRKQKISIWKRKFSFTKLAKAASYYNQELDQKLKSFNKAGSLNLAKLSSTVIFLILTLTTACLKKVCRSLWSTVRYQSPLRALTTANGMKKFSNAARNRRPATKTLL